MCSYQNVLHWFLNYVEITEPIWITFSIGKICGRNRGAQSNNIGLNYFVPHLTFKFQTSFHLDEQSTTYFNNLCLASVRYNLQTSHTNLIFTKEYSNLSAPLLFFLARTRKSLSNNSETGQKPHMPGAFHQSVGTGPSLIKVHNMTHVLVELLV